MSTDTDLGTAEVGEKDAEGALGVVVDDASSGCSSSGLRLE